MSTDFRLPWPIKSMHNSEWPPPRAVNISMTDNNSDPPAIYNETLELYYTTCNATAPSFGVTIDGKTFMQPPEVGFYHLLSADGLCATSFFRGFEEPSAEMPDGYYCLGDVFMFNVVAVFDSDNQFHFAPHTYTDLGS